MLETKNHFKLFDYMIDNVDAQLTIDMIIEMNKILKRMWFVSFLATLAFIGWLVITFLKPFVPDVLEKLELSLLFLFSS